MTIIRWYQAERNPDDVYLPGVPLADLDQATYDRMGAWRQGWVDTATNDAGQKYWLQSGTQPPPDGEPVTPAPEPAPAETPPPEDGGGA